ncbi:DUF3087 domain-containing protein [Pseudomonas sp. DWP3-1-2]|jgi:hypothetical protein|uniref:DUF3087 domain-containing protein n=1 Tax=Pseudomonas sp. DWP3-1-2 TaxID=2804645 RepID=UPI003CE6B52B
MFEIKPMDPHLYRTQTRRSTLIIAVVFAVSALVLSSLAVQLFGVPGGDNFRLNLAGVIVALLLMIALVRFIFWSQPWMAPAVYSWQLKRSLMSITNVMHHINHGVAANDPSAMKLLRFYHLALAQMHLLDGNTGAHSELLRDSEQHKDRMTALAMDTEQNRLDPAWLEAVKRYH